MTGDDCLVQCGYIMALGLVETGAGYILKYDQQDFLTVGIWEKEREVKDDFKEFGLREQISGVVLS